MPKRRLSELRSSRGSENSLGLKMREYEQREHEDWQRKRVREWVSDAGNTNMGAAASSDLDSDDGEPTRGALSPIVAPPSNDANDDDQEPPANRRRIATFDWEDWEDLKQLYSDAVEHVEQDNAASAIELLRGVIHECTRFLSYFQDPSTFFIAPKTTFAASSPRVLTPSEERMRRDWASDGRSSPGDDRPSTGSGYKERTITPRATQADAFTFHAIYGATLFYFGSIVSQTPDLLKSGEPTSPESYYLTALEVFQTAENLLSQLSRTSISLESADDWQMAIVWGRTLIAYACERFGKLPPSPALQSLGKSPATSTTSDPIPSLIPHHSRKNTTDPYRSPFPAASPTMEFSHSPFALPRPIMDYSHSTPIPPSYTSPREVFIIAKDQLLRGIFHIPHSSSTASTPQNHTSPPASSRSKQLPSSPPRKKHLELPKGTPREPSPKTLAPTARFRTLFTIGIELLQAAELFTHESDKLQWAEYADVVLGQLDSAIATTTTTGTAPSSSLDNHVDATFRASIKDARGRCCLVVGSALAEPVESKLEAGVANALDSDAAKDAREALQRSVGHFEALLQMISSGEVPQEKFDETGQLLAEALLTLGNLTEDPSDQKALYSRAKEVGGTEIEMGDDNSEETDEFE